MPAENADPAGTKVAGRQAGPLEQDSGGGVQAQGQWQLPEIAPQQERGPQACVHRPPALWAHVGNLSAGETSFLRAIIPQWS